MHLLPNLRELQALKPERGWEVSGWAAGGGVRVPQRQPSPAGFFPASPLSPPLLPFLLLGRWAGGGVALVPWFFSLPFSYSVSLSLTSLPCPLALPHPLLSLSFSPFFSCLSDSLSVYRSHCLCAACISPLVPLFPYMSNADF